MSIIHRLPKVLRDNVIDFIGEAAVVSVCVSWRGAGSGFTFDVKNIEKFGIFSNSTYQWSLSNVHADSNSGISTTPCRYGNLRNLCLHVENLVQGVTWLHSFVSICVSGSSNLYHYTDNQDWEIVRVLMNAIEMNRYKTPRNKR